MQKEFPYKVKKSVGGKQVTAFTPSLPKKRPPESLAPTNSPVRREMFFLLEANLDRIAPMMDAAFAAQRIEGVPEQHMPQPTRFKAVIMNDDIYVAWWSTPCFTAVCMGMAKLGINPSNWWANKFGTFEPERLAEIMMQDTTWFRWMPHFAVHRTVVKGQGNTVHLAYARNWVSIARTLVSMEPPAWWDIRKVYVPFYLLNDPTLFVRKRQRPRGKNSAGFNDFSITDEIGDQDVFVAMRIESHFVIDALNRVLEQLQTVGDIRQPIFDLELCFY